MATQKQYSLDLESGSSQYASITDASQTGLDLSGDLTFEAWIKVGSFATTNTVIAKYTETGDERAYIFRIRTNNTLDFIVSDDGSATNGHFLNFRTTSGVVASTGVWYHIAVTFDISGESATFYLDGDVVASSKVGGTTMGATIYNSAEDFIIGARNSPTDYYDGLITELRVWNDIRTQNEIITNMSRQLVGNETNLQGYWKFENDYTDETSNGNDLTSSGSPVFASDADDVPFTYYLESGDNFASLDLELSSSQYADISDNASLSITGDLTMECWIKMEQLPSTAGSTYMMMSKFNDEGVSKRSYSFGIAHDISDKMVVYWSADGSTSNYRRFNCDTGFTSADVGVWIHVAVSIDVSAQAVTFYINGEAQGDTLLGSAGTATSIDDNDSSFAIGCRRDVTTPSGFFDGKIDNARIWDDIRTATEIRENMFVEVPSSTTNMQGCWLFNTDYTDESSNGNDLTASGSPVFVADWAFDEAINRHSLDLELSSSQYAYHADNASLSITGDISIECWFKLEQLPSTAGADMVLVSKWNGTNRSYLARLDSSYGGTTDTLVFEFSQDGGAVNIVTVKASSSYVDSNDVGVWVHFAVTADVSEGASGVTIYKNGSAVSDTDVNDSATSIDDNASRFSIGEYSSSSYFDGQIDDVRIWNDVRTPTEISDNYDQILNGDEAGLVAYWRLDNNYADLTSNGNWLTPSASPVFNYIVPFDPTAPAPPATGGGTMDLRSKFWGY